MRPMSKRVGWLCLALMLWSVFAFAAHSHLRTNDSATCRVCVAAHSASPAVHAHARNPVFFTVRLVQTADPTSAKQRLIAFALTVRPPPEG